jgi:hypothetical protein
MVRKQKGRKRKDLKRSRAKDCCGCSILSWEKKKFDNFNKLFFSDTLHGTDYEQHWLLVVPPVCNGGGLNARGVGILCVMIAYVPSTRQ